MVSLNHHKFVKRTDADRNFHTLFLGNLDPICDYLENVVWKLQKFGALHRESVVKVLGELKGSSWIIDFSRNYKSSSHVLPPMKSCSLCGETLTPLGKCSRSIQRSPSSLTKSKSKPKPSSYYLGDFVRKRKNEMSYTIWVGNLSPRDQAHFLKKTFQHCGSILSVQVVPGKFGLIQFANEKITQNALSMDGTHNWRVAFSETYTWQGSKRC